MRLITLIPLLALTVACSHPVKVIVKDDHGHQDEQAFEVVID